MAFKIKYFTRSFGAGKKSAEGRAWRSTQAKIIRHARKKAHFVGFRH